MDGLFSDVRETSWGAVVTDGRFPAIWDANYARIDVPDSGIRSADIEAELVPALERVGCGTMHVVSFHPEATRPLLSELSRRGHRLGWDVVMELEAPPMRVSPAVHVEELSDDDELWTRVGDSLGMFSTVGSSPAALDQLQRIERDVLSPGGKRWFGVRDAEGSIVSLAALLMLEEVGYIDNVATFPEARLNGYASAVTSHLARVAVERGASMTCLLTDPDSPELVRLYRRLGFREAGRLASTRGPVDRSR